MLQQGVVQAAGAGAGLGAGSPAKPLTPLSPELPPPPPLPLRGEPLAVGVAAPLAVPLGAEEAAAAFCCSYSLSCPPRLQQEAGRQVSSRFSHRTATPLLALATLGPLLQPAWLALGTLTK